MEATQKTSALSVNMTEGSLWKNMLLFSLPLMLTQVLEVLFNLSDVAIAGKFADYRALGAVGSTTLLVSLFTGLLIGMGSGVNVAVARGLGMGDRQRVEKTVHTSFVLCAAIGVVLCLICVLLARPMLTLLHTKDELMDGAVLYLKIYALSMPAMAVYNCGNGIMSAVGDTRRPLLYLSVAGVLNVVLNLFFVIRCHMAAEGVAIASVIAQCLSALLIVLHLLRRKDACRLELRRLRVHPQEARRVLAIGIPTGLQNAIFAVANLFVQVGLNSFDAVTVSGSSAAANADTLLFNIYRLRQLRQPELGRRQNRAHRQKLSGEYVLRRRSGGRVRSAAAVFRPELPGPVCQRNGGHRRGYAAAADHELFLCGVPADGRQHRRLPGHRQKRRPHGDRHSGLLRVPGHLGIHRVRLAGHHHLPVSAVYLLLDHHRRRRDRLFPPQL